MRWSRRTTLLALLLIVATAAIAWLALHHKKAALTNTTTPGYVNLNPATNTEKQDSQNAKDAIVNQQNQPSNSTGGSRQVSPFITSASASQVKAYVSGVVEDGGSCTATFTQGYITKTFTSTAAANATNTVCAPISVSGLTAGSWSVVVSYSSATASGSSAAVTVKV